MGSRLRSLADIVNTTSKTKIADSLSKIKKLIVTMVEFNFIRELKIECFYYSLGRTDK